MEIHSIKPFYNENSKILILGSFPSIKSREIGFYYSHPQNRFWGVLATVFNDKVPLTIDEKKILLKKNNIALYDVCASCEIKGSSDASIKDVVPSNLDEIINNADIKLIILNGKTAFNLYQKYFKNKYNIKTICLPSTSPANAKFTFANLVREYKILNSKNVN